MHDKLTIRAARPADLPVLVDIYNHYVLRTPVTFDTTVFTIEQRQAWFDAFDENGIHRLIVAERAGVVVGYASSSVFKPRAAYDTSVETSVYLDPPATGAGIGSSLYGELIRQLADHPRLHRAYGGIALPNDASVSLHLKLGFAMIGTYREVGYKFDRYWDVAWYEKDLSG